MIFKLTSVVERKVVTDKKKWQFDIYNVCDNAKKVRHDYAVGYLVYANMTGIYQKTRLYEIWAV